MRTRVQRCTATGFALAAVLFACAALARAQVMDQVPADALMVIKVKNLKATSDKVAKFATDLGLAQMVQQMADPLGALEQELKITAGVDAAGDLAFVMVDPDKFGGDPDRAGMLLIPVTDYQAFLGNFPDAKTEGDVSEVKLADAPQDHFVAKWGNFAAVSMNRDLVATKPSATMKLTAAAVRESEAKDVIVLANLPTIRAKLLPKIEENREKILSEVEDQMKNEERLAKFAPPAGHWSDSCSPPPKDSCVTPTPPRLA